MLSATLSQRKNHPPYDIISSRILITSQNKYINKNVQIYKFVIDLHTYMYKYAQYSFQHIHRHFKVLHTFNKFYLTFLVTNHSAIQKQYTYNSFAATNISKSDKQSNNIVTNVQKINPYVV